LISSTFYKQLWHQYSNAKKLLGLTGIRKKLHKALSYEKGTCKMIDVKLGKWKCAPGRVSVGDG